MEKEELNNIIENTLHSLDGLKKTEPNGFILTRVKQRITEINEKNKTKKLLFNPMWKLAIIFLILIMINILSMINYSNRSNETTSTTAKHDINSFINEYSISNSTYNY